MGAPKFTLARVRAFTVRAMRDSGVSAEIVSINWLGQRTQARGDWKGAPESSRAARVVLRAADGRLVGKAAVLYSDGGFRIA